MTRVVVDVPDDLARELRAAGLDPAQIVRDSARRGIVETLEAVRTGTAVVAGAVQGAALPVAMSKSRVRSRPVIPALDAVGVPSTDATGKIGVPVVRAADLEDPRVK